MVLMAVQLSVPGLYLPPVFKLLPLFSAPDDHFAAGPDCRVRVSGSGRAGGAGGCPTVCAGIVSPAGVQIRPSTSIHPRRSFRCRSTLPCEPSRPAGALVVLVAVQLSCWDYISRRYSNIVDCYQLRPRRSFGCRSTLPCDARASGRVDGAGGCPTIGAGIVSPAGVQSTPITPPQTIISLPVQTAV